jgi:hypothetical protein
LNGSELNVAEPKQIATSIAALATMSLLVEGLAEAVPDMVDSAARGQVVTITAGEDLKIKAVPVVDRSTIPEVSDYQDFQTKRYSLCRHLIECALGLDVYRSSNSEQPEYDEYDAGEDDGRRFASRDRSAAARNVRDMVAPVKTAAPPHSSNTEKQKPAVVQDLFDFGDDDFGGNAAAMATPAATSTKTILDDDGELGRKGWVYLTRTNFGYALDDFADFQEAKVLPVAASEGVPPPNAPAAGQDVFNLLDNLPPAQAAPRASPAKPVVYSPVSAIPKPAANVVQSKGGFDDLWSLSLAGAGGISSPNGSSNTNKKSMLDLDREKTMNSLWGASPATKASSKSAFDDLLG